MGPNPNVPFIKLDPMRGEKSAVLVLKRHALMMFFVVFDVSDDVNEIRLTHRECCVSTLPMELREFRDASLIHPDDVLLTSLMTLAIACVRESANKECVWSSTPPTMSVSQSCLRSISARYACISRRRTLSVRNGNRSFVENMRCVQRRAKD